VFGREWRSDDPALTTPWRAAKRDATGRGAGADLVVKGKRRRIDKGRRLSRTSDVQAEARSSMISEDNYFN